MKTFNIVADTPAAAVALRTDYLVASVEVNRRDSVVVAAAAAAVDNQAVVAEAGTVDIAVDAVAVALRDRTVGHHC